MPKRRKYERLHEETKHFRTLNVSPLPAYATEAIIKSYFSAWGPVERVCIPHDIETNNPTEYGFVIFSNADTLEKVQKNRPHRIDGTEVFTRRALPTKENIAEGKACTQVLYFKAPVANSPTKQEILEYFQQYGRVVKGPLVTENNEEKIIFIEFDDYDPVDKLFLKERNVIGNYSFKISKLISNYMSTLYEQIKSANVGSETNLPHANQTGIYFVNIESFPHSLANATDTNTDPYPVTNMLENTGKNESLFSKIETYYVFVALFVVVQIILIIMILQYSKHGHRKS